MKPYEPTPKPQSAAVPPSDRQHLDAIMRIYFTPLSGDLVTDRSEELKSDYAVMRYFGESDFTHDGHLRRVKEVLWLALQQIGELEAEKARTGAGNAGLVTDIQFVLVPIMGGGQL
jgi:hypothetical protein